MTIEEALTDLESKDYFVWDGFLTPEEIVSITSDYQGIYDRGEFALAGTGSGQQRRSSVQKIRSDETFWLDPLSLSVPQRIFWNRLESLKHRINERFYLGLWELGGHYSHYPASGSYQKHLDRFNNDDQRTLSMVLYFNLNWRSGEGGELRIHAGGKNQTSVDVTPVSGRLVCFLSSSVLHEVLTTHRSRWSFAGWWKRR